MRAACALHQNELCIIKDGRFTEEVESGVQERLILRGKLVGAEMHELALELKQWLAATGGTYSDVLFLRDGNVYVKAITLEQLRDPFEGRT